MHGNWPVLADDVSSLLSGPPGNRSGEAADPERDLGEPVDPRPLPVAGVHGRVRPVRVESLGVLFRQENAPDAGVYVTDGGQQVEPARIGDLARRHHAVD